MAPKENAAAAEELQQEVLFVFEDTDVEEQLVALLGCSALTIDDELEQGTEVVIEVRGKVQETRIVTKQRGDRAGGRDVTRAVRVVKVDSGKLTRTIPKLVK